MVTINGNLFKANTGNGIQNDGTAVNNIGEPIDLPAEYNSWGDYDGPTGTDGDGVGGSVDVQSLDLLGGLRRYGTQYPGTQ